MQDWIGVDRTPMTNGMSVSASIAGAFALLMTLGLPAFAQTSNCGGLASTAESDPPRYPPIDRAAHVTGRVITMIVFEPNGRAASASVVSGPKLLQESALSYVKGLRANDYTGPRTCAIVVSYILDDRGESVLHIDPQHVVLKAMPLIISDPPVYLSKGRRKRFLLF